MKTMHLQCGLNVELEILLEVVKSRAAKGSSGGRVQHLLSTRATLTIQRVTHCMYAETTGHCNASKGVRLMSLMSFGEMAMKSSSE